jgi:hypothetical protein
VPAALAFVHDAEDQRRPPSADAPLSQVGDEKRSVIVLPSSQYDEWITCEDPELARTFFRLPLEEEMIAEAAPLPPGRSSSQQMTLDGAIDQ